MIESELAIFTRVKKGFLKNNSINGKYEKVFRSSS